jgi:hypothetical protein
MKPALNLDAFPILPNKIGDLGRIIKRRPDGQRHVSEGIRGETGWEGESHEFCDGSDPHG